MMKAIVDTNVFMSGIFWAGPPAKILQAWNEKKFEIVLSKEILEEYMRVGNVLARKYEGVNLDPFFELLVIRANIYDIPPWRKSVCRDPNDEMFISCAVATNTKIIISGDKDLLEISGHEGIQVLKPKNFMDTYL